MDQSEERRVIRVTVFNEDVQEHWDETIDPAWSVAERAQLAQIAREVRRVHPLGIHGTLKALLETQPDLRVRVATLSMPECGLSEEVLADTDVLLWWSHVAHDRVPDEVAARVQQHVLRSMGFLPLHSSHLCKPMRLLLGTSCTLCWREGDFCRVWTLSPSHPIAAGVPESFELPEEEMYGEFFDIPQPDELVFASWFRGGELFRSGCVFRRGYGRIFYFQPGHETNGSYFNEHVRRILLNAVRWLAPERRADKLSCPHAAVSPEEHARGGTENEL